MVKMANFMSYFTTKKVGEKFKHFKSHIVLYTFPMLEIHHNKLLYKVSGRTSLVVQWLRICLLMQGTRVRSLVREDPTCRRATKPVHHNYWACVLQLLKPACLEPVLHNKEKPLQWEARALQWRVAFSPQLEKAWVSPRSNEDPVQPNK